MAMDSNIVEFPSIVARRAPARKPQTSKNGNPQAAGVELEARSTAKGDRRKLRGNPLRLKFAPISSAVTIAGKMHTAALRDEPLSYLRPDILQQWLGELRAGADSARIVANELDQAAEDLGKVRSVSKAAAKSPAAVLSSDEFVAHMACLDQDGRQFIIDYMNLLLAKRSP